MWLCFQCIFTAFASVSESLPDIYLSEGEAAVIDLSTVFAGTLLNYSVRGDPQHRASVLTDFSPTQQKPLSRTAMRLGPVFEGSTVLLYSDRRIELWSESGEEIWGIDTRECIQGVGPPWRKNIVMVWTTPQHVPGVLYTLNVAAERPELVQLSGVGLPQSSVIAVCNQLEDFFIITGERSKHAITHYTIDFDGNTAIPQVERSFDYEKGEIIDAVCTKHLYYLTPEMLLSDNGFSIYISQRFGRPLRIHSLIDHTKWTIATDSGALFDDGLLAFEPNGRFEIEQYSKTSLYVVKNGNELRAVYHWLSSNSPTSCIVTLSIPFPGELLDVKTLRVTKELAESVVLVSTMRGVFIYRVPAMAPAVLVRAGPEASYSFQLCAEELPYSDSTLCKTVTLVSPSSAAVSPSEVLSFSCFLTQPGQGCSCQLPDWISGAGLAISSSNPALTIIPPFQHTSFEFEASENEHFLCYEEFEMRFFAVSMIGENVTYADLGSGVRTRLNLPAAVSCTMIHPDIYFQSSEGNVYSLLSWKGIRLELSLGVQGRLLQSSSSPFLLANATLYERHEGRWLSLSCGCYVLDVCRAEDMLLVLCEGVVSVYAIRHENYSLSVAFPVPSEVISIKYWNRRLVTLTAAGTLTVYFLSSSGRLVLQYAVKLHRSCRFVDGGVSWQSAFLACEQRIIQVDVSGKLKSRVMWEESIQRGAWAAITNRISTFHMEEQTIKASAYTSINRPAPVFQIQYHSSESSLNSSVINSTLQIVSSSDSLSIPLSLTVRNVGAFLSLRQSAAVLTVPWSHTAGFPLWDIAGGSSLHFSIASGSNTDDITVTNACEVQYTVHHECRFTNQMHLFLGMSVVFCMNLSALEVAHLKCKEQECITVRRHVFSGADLQLSFLVEFNLLIATGSWAILSVRGISDSAPTHFQNVMAKIDLQSLSLTIISSYDISEELYTMEYVVKETESLYHLFTSRVSLRHHVISLVNGDPVSVHEEQYADYRLVNVESISSEKQGDLWTLYVLIRSKQLFVYRLQGRLTLVKVFPTPLSLYALPCNFQLCRDRFILVNSTAAYSFSLPDFTLLGVAHPSEVGYLIQTSRNLIEIDAECNRVALPFQNQMTSILDFTAPAESTSICTVPGTIFRFSGEGAYGIHYQKIDVLALSYPRLVIKSAEPQESVRRVRLAVRNWFGETAEVTVSVIRYAEFRGKWVVGVSVLCGLLVCLVFACQWRRQRTLRGEIEMESRTLNNDRV